MESLTTSSASMIWNQVRGSAGALSAAVVAAPLSMPLTYRMEHGLKGMLTPVTAWKPGEVSDLHPLAGRRLGRGVFR